MPVTKANNLDIVYDTFGDPRDPALLLIMGLGTQMIAWPERFCAMLADRGFHVVRFDNRDIGLSQKMEGAPRYSLPAAYFRAWMGLPVHSPYTLDDMAADAVGLLDALGIARAHIVGASMGGMIAQIMAATYPQRCLSLVSIMSTSGEWRMSQPSPQARRMLFAKRPPADDREAIVRFGMDMLRTIGSRDYPTPEAELRSFVEAAMARSIHPAGFVRQLLAVIANGSRVELLKTIRAPTLVLHGEADPLVPLAGGQATARHIPGARLETIPGWGHDLPAQLWPRLVDAIAGHCGAVERQPSA